MSSNKRGRQKEFQQTVLPTASTASCHEWGRGCVLQLLLLLLLYASSCCKTQMCLALSFCLRVNHIFEKKKSELRKLWFSGYGIIDSGYHANKVKGFDLKLEAKGWQYELCLVRIWNIKSGKVNSFGVISFRDKLSNCYVEYKLYM